MKSRIVQPTAVHKKFYKELALLTQRFCEEEGLTDEEALALSAYGVGTLIAMQNHKTMSPQRAMNIVSENIEQGNAHAMTQKAIGKITF